MSAEQGRREPRPTTERRRRPTTTQHHLDDRIAQAFALETREIDPRCSRLFLSAVWIPLAGADFQDCQVSNFVTRVRSPSLPTLFNLLDHLLESRGGPHSRGVTKLPLSKNSQKDDHGRKSFVGRAGRLLRAQAVSVLAPGPVLPKS